MDKSINCKLATDVLTPEELQELRNKIIESNGLAELLKVKRQQQRRAMFVRVLFVLAGVVCGAALALVVL